MQVTVTAAAFAFQDQLRLRIGGSVVLQQMAIGAHLSARLVTSTATVELSGTGSNAARGRIITTKIP